MKKGDTLLYLAIIVLLFDFITPIPGTIKFVVSIVLVTGIIITAIMRIVGGMKNKQPPKE